MYIKSLIQNRLFNKSFKIVDPKGVEIDSAKFQKDFVHLRNWLSVHCGDTAVGINLPKDHRYMMTVLACMDAGVVYVPMKDNFPENRISQIKEESGFTVLINAEKFSEIEKAPAVEFIQKDLSEDSTLYIICTSGSTGRPKAVVIQRKAITHFWKWVNTYFSNVGEQDRALQVTDFTSDISLIDVGLFLGRGPELYFSQFSGNVFHLAYDIETYGITYLNTVVNNLNMLLDDKVVGRADYSTLHTVLIGGARFSYGLYKKCMEHLSKIGIHNIYGVTEVPVYSHCTQLKFDESDQFEFNITVGKPLGACTSIVVKDGKVLPAFERGEILIGGDSMMKEYAGNPEKTAEVFCEVDGAKYYRSGDIGFINDAGLFFITGRMDDTIKHRGYRINLLDVDSYILSKDYVQDCVTIGIENDETQNTTVCFIISKKEDQKTEKEVKKDLSDVLLEYQIPERIHFVDNYPVNNTGKVCKKTLKKDYIEGKRFYR